MYLPFKHKVWVRKTQIDTYGIKVLDSNNKTIRVLYDISTNEIAIKDLVERLNAEVVEPVHLDSIIFDFHSKYC